MRIRVTQVSTNKILATGTPESLTRRGFGPEVAKLLEVNSTSPQTTGIIKTDPRVSWNEGMVLLQIIRK